MSEAQSRGSTLLYDPGTREEIKARFQVEEERLGIQSCFHSGMVWTCRGCLWGQLYRSEMVIRDYRDALLEVESGL